jgi:hypothetical protein
MMSIFRKMPSNIGHAAMQPASAPLAQSKLFAEAAGVCTGSAQPPHPLD